MRLDLPRFPRRRAPRSRLQRHRPRLTTPGRAAAVPISASGILQPFQTVTAGELQRVIRNFYLEAKTATSHSVPGDVPLLLRVGQFINNSQS